VRSNGSRRSIRVITINSELGLPTGQLSTSVLKKIAAASTDHGKDRLRDRGV
jgi:hypothetical protein